MSGVSKFSAKKGILSEVPRLIGMNYTYSMFRQSPETSDRLGDSICHMYSTEKVSI